MNADLTTLLNYQNKAVLDYFAHHHPEFTLRKRQTIFKDLMAWMWLHNFRATQGKKTYLFGPLLILDEMWHSFILHTRDYVEFSNQYFGCYFHHDIEPIGSEHTMQDDELMDFIHECFNHLGSKWVKRCFKEALLQLD